MSQYSPYMQQQPYGYTQQMQQYSNPYQSRLNAMEVMQASYAPSQNVIKVNGEKGANSFMLPPNSTALLLDETEPIVWFAQTDGAGYKTITPYLVSPYKSEPKVDIESLETRIKRLEELINGQSDTKISKSNGTETTSTQE